MIVAQNRKRQFGILKGILTFLIWKTFTGQLVCWGTIRQGGLDYKIELQYARHYNRQFVDFFTPFFTAVYIVERFIMQSSLYFIVLFFINALSKSQQKVVTHNPAFSS